MQDTWVRSLGREDPWEEEIATHSSIVGWEIPWTEEPGRLRSRGSPRVRPNLATKEERQQVQKALTVNPEKLNQTGNGDAPDFVLDRSLASPLMWIIYIVSNLCESLQ